MATLIEDAPAGGCRAESRGVVRVEVGVFNSKFAQGRAPRRQREVQVRCQGQSRYWRSDRGRGSAPATQGGSCRRTGAYRAPAAMGIMTMLYPNAHR